VRAFKKWRTLRQVFLRQNLTALVAELAALDGSASPEPSDHLSAEMFAPVKRTR
jgi:hypothetical protein